MTGSWHAVFLAAAALNIVAAFMALLVLKPMRKAYVGDSNAAAGAPARGPVIADSRH